MFAASLAAATIAVSATASGQTASTFEKKNYNYSEWAKGRFFAHDFGGRRSVKQSQTA